MPQGTARSQSEPEVGQFSQTLSLKPNWQSPGPNLQNSTKFVLKIKFWSPNSYAYLEKWIFENFWEILMMTSLTKNS